ncbi:MAG: Type 1 glutamine amidotransferase-like domain-containing protein [Bacillus subtilis]|nr:Type 1 glutamine amidotransferase-like domain-containing protein [Bacillus subtilis]
MRLLLTSGGITNPSIKKAFLNLLGKRIEDSTALCITSASYAFRNGPYLAYEFITGKNGAPMCDLGFTKIGLLEITALPHISDDILQNQLENVDVILVNGGDPLFLYHFFRQSKLLSHILNDNILYVGLSAGEYDLDTGYRS